MRLPLSIILFTICWGLHCSAVNQLDLILDLADFFSSSSILVLDPLSPTKSNFVHNVKAINLKKKYFMTLQANATNRNTDLAVVTHLDSALDSVIELLQSRQRVHKEPWLLFSNDPSMDLVLEKLSPAKLDLDDEVIVALENSTDYHLHEVYKISSNRSIQTNIFGHWTPLKKLEVTQVPKWYRRRNLQGHHFSLTTLVETPMTSSMKFNQSIGSYSVQGSFPDLLDILAGTMNFTYSFQAPADNAWGGKQPDGSWNGMIHMVQSELVDFAPTSLIQTKERSVVTSWTVPLLFSYQSIFIKNPANVYNYTAFLEPLTSMSWLAIGLFLVAITPFLHWMSKVALNEKSINVSQSLESVYLSLLLLGSDRNPIGLPTRILFWSILISSALIYWHWEAMLVSYLATRKTQLPFKNLKEMYEKTDFRLALIPDTSFEDKFKYSPNELWRQIYAQRLAPHLDEYSQFMNSGNSDMIGLIKDDYSTALYDAYLAISSSQDFQDCLIVATEGKYFHQPYAWPFQKHSPYLDIFNFFIKETIEKGQWNAIINKYKVQPQVCPDMSGQPIEFSNCFTAFLALIFGLLAALIILLLEFLVRPHDHHFMGDWTEVTERHHLERTIYLQRERIQSLRAELSIYRRLYGKSKWP